MDEETRNRIQRAAQAARVLLEQEFEEQLEGVFDIRLDGTMADEPGSHLNAAQRVVRTKLVAAVEHLQSGGQTAAEAVASYLREAAFTTLNRFVALKMLEARELVQECISRGEQSSGFKEFTGLAPGLVQLPDHGYRLYIESLFDEIGREVWVLFDQRDPASLLWPGRSALFGSQQQRGFLVILNDPDLAGIWDHDETIGWVYQYYNDPAERKKMREESAAPRNSHELAVRNQFFTPRYVVKFLTDNTLGRVWYEMRQGETRLVEECDYLVRRPSEVFLAEGEEASENEAVAEEDLSQEELPKKTVYIPFRPKKDPRDIKNIDPACGSGHFLLYAFDLLVTIYEEAWSDPDLGPPLWHDFGFVPQLSKESGRYADPMTVALVPDAVPHCFCCGISMRQTDAQLILADLYDTPWTAGRPMVYCDKCCGEHSDRIRHRMPLAQFSFADALRLGWFWHSTGTTFLEIAKVFRFRVIPDGNHLFEQLQAAASDEGLTHLRPRIPELILRHNLHGIDIDPRAAQIAALALWMRAQRAYQVFATPRAERFSITKTNIVVAEPMPGEATFLDEFITAHLSATPEQRLLGQLVRRVFGAMQLAGEAGSLLKIEEEIAGALKEAKRKWLSGPTPEQLGLFGDEPRLPEQRMLDLDTTGITDERFWEQAEERIYAALRAYAEQAENGRGYQRRLFAYDTAQGFAFIDACRQRYDVTLMNQPFGDASLPSKPYLDDTYGDTKGDVYKAFVECFQARLVPAGYLGIISSRTGFFLGQSEDWRTRVVLRQYRPIVLADLGMGVLDAMVEVAAYVLRSLSESEARDLTLSLVPVLEKVVRDRQERFSLPKWQAARDGLKRHQAVAELEHIEAEGFIRRSPGDIVRYTPLWQAVKDINTPPQPVFPPFVCVRAIGKEDKAVALCNGIGGMAPFETFVCNPAELSNVPGTPFAYWVRRSIVSLFKTLPRLEIGGRVARRTNGTTDDGRWIRASWEIKGSAGSDFTWVPHAKGGTFAPFYSDLHLVIAWDGARQTYPGYLGTFHRPDHRPASRQYFFCAGLTWPRRTDGLSFRILPTGAIFGDKGPGVFVEGDDPHQLLCLCAIVNSTIFRYLVQLQLARVELAQSFEAGLIQQTPVPRTTTESELQFAHLAHRVWREKRALDSVVATSHAFLLPAVLFIPGSTLADRAAAWAARVRTSEATVATIQTEIDDLAFRLYGLDTVDRAALTSTLSTESTESIANAAAKAVENKEKEAVSADTPTLTIDLLDYTLGTAFGRWDLRFAIGEKPVPPEPDPFDPLPVCPPGQLQNEQGLPITQEEVGRLKDEGRWNYPLDTPWNGILVDDPGHPLDLEVRIHQVLQAIWPGSVGSSHWESIEREACEILGVPALRNFFRMPNGAFSGHLKRYSKSRRKAPIYWQLATPSADYSVWLYYHRFTKDTFYKVLNDYVTPKLQHEERKLTSMAQDGGGNPTASQRKEIADKETFVEELRAFRQEVAHITPLWNPNLNDGVIINFAPLWRLVPQHRAWQKECRKCWDKLAAGDYDWAHLAMHLWPERVVPKCTQDHSLAIAHGLEHAFWEENDDGKWQQREVTQHEIDQLIAERTSAAVKDALNSLLEAPAPVTGRRRSSARTKTRRKRAGPRSGTSSANAPGSSRSATPDAAVLDAVKKAIAASNGGAGKADVLSSTGLTDSQWNAAINALLADGAVTKIGTGRSTRYHPMTDN